MSKSSKWQTQEGSINESVDGEDELSIKQQSGDKKKTINTP